MRQVCETSQASDAVGQQYCMGSSVEDLSNRLEGFLSCRIPDLEFEDSLFHFDKQGSELNADCDLMIFRELVCGHSMHKTRLSYS